jgi:membrane-bound lytic murein transglycosylase A
MPQVTKGFWIFFSLLAVSIAAFGLVSLYPAFGPDDDQPPVQSKDFRRLSAREAGKVVRKLDLRRQGLGSWTELREPLRKSLDYAAAKPPNRAACPAGDLDIQWIDIRKTLRDMLDLLPRLDENPGLLAERFRWYRLDPGPLFTGYFEPLIPASMEPRPDYPYPIYGVPENLKVAHLGRFHPRWDGEVLVYRVENGTVVPYYDRKSIEGGNVLRDSAPVIAWAKDPLDVFFLQIQGSGRLVLPDGKVRRIGYAGKNGRQYVSLGRVMAERGYLSMDELSMRSIRDYLQEHSDLLPEILYTNPSYVFFRIAEGGPYGAMGKELTPMVSLATDPGLLPLGSVMAYAVDLPRRQGPNRPLCGLGLSQDVGGAIQGAHLDIFCGAGKRARDRAGHLKNRGSLYLLLSKDAARICRNEQ